MSNFLVLISTLSGYLSISAFASLVVIHIAITRFAKCLKICAITTWIKKYKSIIKKKKEKHNKILPLAKSKLNSVEVLISEVFIDSDITHNEFVLINNVPKEINDIKEEVRNSNEK